MSEATSERTSACVIRSRAIAGIARGLTGAVSAGTTGSVGNIGILRTGGKRV
jgi:hypothetical protein